MKNKKKSKKGKISVIIPTYNSWRTLKECVASLLRQTVRPSEIIVVDNGSTDKTCKNIRSFFPKIRLIQLKKNTGVTGGRNMGINVVDSKVPYLCFFDHDMVADRKMLGELLKGIDNDNDIGIAAPKIYYHTDKKRIWSAGTGINLWTGKVWFRGGKDVGQYDLSQEIEIAPAAMLVKKEVIDKIKGFDDRYFVTFEDSDFCFRAKKKKFSIVYIPAAVAYHQISPDLKIESRRLLDRAFWIGRNRILFMKDFGKIFYVFLLFLPFYCVYYLKLAIENKRPKAFLSFMKGITAGFLS